VDISLEDGVYVTIKKSCPFCGEKEDFKSLEDGLGFMSVHCQFCEATGPRHGDHRDAVNGWNQRVNKLSITCSKPVERGWRNINPKRLAK